MLYSSSKIVEFERNASTMRTDSKALTLGENLVTTVAFDVFRALCDFRPRPRPDYLQPDAVKKRVREEQEREQEQERVARVRASAWAWPRERVREYAKEWEGLRESALEAARAEALYEKEKAVAPANSGQDAKEQLWKDAMARARWWAEGAWDFKSSWTQDWEVARAWEQKQKPEPRDLERELERPLQDWDFERKHLWERLWGGGWLMRVRDERASLEGDHSDWGELAWLLQRAWWNDVEEWGERREERMGAFDKLKKTCLELLEEIRKIDGSASAQEFDIFYSESVYQEDDRQLVGHYIDDMKDAMDHGDEDRCIGCCNALFDLFRTRLRSEEVKQGASLSCECSRPLEADNYIRAQRADQETGSLSKYIHGLRNRRHLLLEHYSNNAAVLVHLRGLQRLLEDRKHLLVRFTRSQHSLRNKQLPRCHCSSVARVLTSLPSPRLPTSAKIF